jgi:hypothetical protein
LIKSARGFKLKKNRSVEKIEQVKKRIKIGSLVCGLVLVTLFTAFRASAFSVNQNISISRPVSLLNQHKRRDSRKRGAKSVSSPPEEYKSLSHGAKN